VEVALIDKRSSLLRRGVDYGDNGF